MNVYIASPLFSETERLFNDSICALIEKSCDVYLPQRDGPLVERSIANGMSSGEVRRLAFESDIDAIKRSDVLIAVLEGRALDEGVCIEMGFAKALGKHIVGFKSDVRIALPWGNNPMVDGCVDMWVHNITELSAYIANPNSYI